ncbi:GNAT family N-acetyltransferase [Clostridium senegalense]|uniref:GNAT family N-acetyltransferase n=1 Tax=Clostridium senegalense TaxID=1465809 RepID=UPI0009D9F542|nr:N-acetyltransferase [Clostridium senegalense]
MCQIAVKPGYSGRGIGTNMIKKALTMLNEEYLAIRLYVDIGNKAEDLYYKLGFLKGSELINMKLVENLIGE